MLATKYAYAYGHGAACRSLQAIGADKVLIPQQELENVGKVDFASTLPALSVIHARYLQ